MNKFILVLTSLIAAGAAMAKLPVPSDEAKAKAEEAKAKSAWGDRLAAYQLCRSQDKAAAYYLKSKGTDMKPMPTPACADPGPYVAAAAGTPAPAPAVAAPVPSAPKK
jgi:hypothetical protein